MSWSGKTDIDGMAKEIAKAIAEYDQNVSDATKEAVQEQAEETVEEIRLTSPRKTGNYAKGWNKKTAYEATYEKRDTVYNKKRYQLTHLLEKGHVRKNTDRAKKVHISRTSRTAARVHLAPAEENAKKGLEEKIRKKVGKL